MTTTEGVILPSHQDTLLLAGPAASGPDSDLPPYSRRHTIHPSCHPASADHVFTLTNGKGRPWATLKLISSATTSGRMPTYYQGDHITGYLELNLEKRDAIMSINAITTGKVIIGARIEDSFKFHDQSTTIWSKSMGDPRSTMQGDYKGKLHGEYIWPISIEIPRTANIPSCPRVAGHKVSDLPPTFREPNIEASVEYTLTIRISRSMLRSASVLTTNFTYITVTRPEPLSLLRQIAYRESALLPGPDADPNGWTTTDVAISRGAFNGARPIAAKYRLWLAKPLCYTRGGVIPCLLDIECADRKALDLLSSTTAAVVTLQRRVRYFLACASQAVRMDVGWKEVVEDVNSVVWWPSVEGARTSSRISRRLDGEIRLSRSLYPSSEMGSFSVSYAIVVQPFRSPSYKPGRTEPLLVQPVSIATRYAKGPIPKPFSPPAYDPPKLPACPFVTDPAIGSAFV